MRRGTPLRKACLVIALLTVVVALAPTVAPAADAEVRLVVGAADKLLSDHEPFTWQDDVPLAALPPGATGLDLLDHVVTLRGSTYTVTFSGKDAFVDEVNGVETDFTLILVGYYWALYEDGEYADVAINHIELAAGKVIELRYEGFPLDV